MGGRFRLPMFVLAVALLGLIALLATLQYKWLGRISDAEREHMRATLNTSASGFTQDFDSELTRAYLLFQMDPQAIGSLESRMAIRWDRWQATARYPRIIKGIYRAGSNVNDGLQQFNPDTRALDPVVWPAVLEPVRKALAATPEPAGTSGLVVRQMASTVWESIPALLIPMPQFFLAQQQGSTEVRVTPTLSYIVVLLDRDYITTEMLPALGQQHFRRADERFDYQLAVVSPADRGIIYHSTDAFTPSPDAQVD